MTLTFTQHEKIHLKSHPTFNEAWLHDRICDEPAILQLGDVRVLDRERRLTGGGRLDLLLFDEDNNRRFEVEIMLGATDPSHIIRCLEYWDLERRRYPGYEHVAVLIAEDITTRFLNVMSLMSGSLPMVAIQLDALKVHENIILNFVTVLDQTDLRVDDVEDDGGGGEVDRSYWDGRAGADLMRICDQVLVMVNGAAQGEYLLNYLRRYVGLRLKGGSVNNIIYCSPKPTKGIVHLGFRHPDAQVWKDRFEQEGVPVRSKRKSEFRLSLSPKEFAEAEDTIREAVVSAVNEAGA